ncbi:hypothetical protein F5B17DRAFT_385189 [Nemania serpens]|nr:hypothetical protein F5B17DRAFT_385189 [Nemania serpens]
MILASRSWLLQDVTSTIFIIKIDGHAFSAGNDIARQMNVRLVGPRVGTGSLKKIFGLVSSGGV